MLVGSGIYHHHIHFKTILCFKFDFLRNGTLSYTITQKHITTKILHNFNQFKNTLFKEIDAPIGIYSCPIVIKFGMQRIKIWCSLKFNGHQILIIYIFVQNDFAYKISLFRIKILTSMQGIWYPTNSKLS